MTHTTLQNARPSRLAGFTLVEIMISVALVLFLIIGVNQVFKITSDTVGAAQAMSANVRDSRAAQTVIYNDLSGAVMQTPPIFMIASSRVSAFRNQNDAAADFDFAAAATAIEREAAIRTIGMDDDNVEGETGVPGEIISPAIYNSRSHRTDRLGFFARDLFRRQTANDGAYSNNTTSFEAWVWYGHLKMANNAAAFFEPGEDVAGNVNNRHAADFAVGRMVTLLKDPTSITTGEHRLVRGTAPAGTAYPTVNPVPLSPLGFGTRSTGSTGSPSYFIQNSRYDLAGITMTNFGNDLRNYVFDPATGLADNPLWWQRMLYQSDTYPMTFTAGVQPPAFRYEADRFMTKPLTSAQAARIAPILLNGCSQFIVEFAGDYITQNNDPTAGNDYGDRIAGTAGQVPDGIIDFVIDPSTGTPVRLIRWYGMPRDVSGPAYGPNAGTGKGGPDGSIPFPTPATSAGLPPVDVVPVGIVRGEALMFEREFPSVVGTDYALTGGTNGMDPTARYTCVWGPDIYQHATPSVAQNNPLPRMLRITFVLDEPVGRLAEGQTYEFVIDLPR